MAKHVTPTNTTAQAVSCASATPDPLITSPIGSSSTSGTKIAIPSSAIRLRKTSTRLDSCRSPSASPRACAAAKREMEALPIPRSRNPRAPTMPASVATTPYPGAPSARTAIATATSPARTVTTFAPAPETKARRTARVRSSAVAAVTPRPPGTPPPSAPRCAAR